MTLYKNRYRIETARLRNWDYASAAWYFITICVFDRLPLLGNIVDGEMRLSPAGVIVAEEWLKTGTLRAGVELDTWVVMPNHFHAIVVLNGDQPAGNAPVDEKRRGGEGHANGGRRASGGVSTVSPEPTSEHRVTPRNGISAGLKPNSLGSIINQFKGRCVKRSRALDLDFAWQPRYHDHIIRDESSLEKIREYIVNNPLRWDLDENNPANLEKGDAARSRCDLP